MPGSTHGERETSEARSVEMLRSVVEGATYEAVAAQCGVTRTAIERRIKAAAVRLCRRAGIEGLNADAAAYVQRLRTRRIAILAALEAFDPVVAPRTRSSRIVSSDEIELGAQRIRARSSRPWHDQALFLLLFATGARPLEIARLEVRDYLAPDGSVRMASELRAEAANSGRARPLYFTSARLNAALDRYLAERQEHGLGVGGAAAYRGLESSSPLFLSSSGVGFRIKLQEVQGQQRCLCRGILETYRRLFRYAELTDVTPLSVRLTVATRLYERGADEEQVGLLLGINGRSAVREMFPRPRPAVSELVRELI
jgi:integrase